MQKQVLETFNSATDSKILCSEISGKHFMNIEDHTSFIKNGGCAELINTLTES